MELTFRKATSDDLEDIVRIYERSHDAEEAGLTTTGWKRGIYPVRSVAEASLERGDRTMMYRFCTRLLSIPMQEAGAPGLHS